MLCISLTRTFFGARSPEAAGVQALLSEEGSDECGMLAAATGVLGMALLEEEEEGEGANGEDGAARRDSSPLKSSEEGSADSGHKE